MLERQLELDRLRNQTGELARRKPIPPGMDGVQLQMSDLSKFMQYYVTFNLSYIFQLK